MIIAIITALRGPSIAGAMAQFTGAIKELEAVEKREQTLAEKASERAQQCLAEATAAREHATEARKQRELIASLFAKDEGTGIYEGIGGAISNEGVGYAGNLNDVGAGA